MFAEFWKSEDGRAADHWHAGELRARFGSDAHDEEKRRAAASPIWSRRRRHWLRIARLIKGSDIAI